MPLGRTFARDYFRPDRFERDQALRIAILTGAGDQAFCAAAISARWETGMKVPPRDMFPPALRHHRAVQTHDRRRQRRRSPAADDCPGSVTCVASTTAQFAVTEVRVGRSSPAALLIHMIPQRIMMEILLTGNRSARNAPMRSAWSIAWPNRDELMACALALATDFSPAPLSVRAARETVMLATEMGRSAALAAARHARELCYHSDDAQRGPGCRKRRPRWQAP